METAAEFVVESPDVVYSPEAIEAQYEYRTTGVSREGGILKVGKELGTGGLREPGVGCDCLTSTVPNSLCRPPPGAPHVHALHLPDCPSGAPARGHACRLGRQQRLYAHCCRASQPAAPVLAHAHGSQGVGVGRVLGLCLSRCRWGGACREGSPRRRSLKCPRALGRDLWGGFGLRPSGLLSS